MTNELRDDPLVPQAEPGGGCSIPPPGERPKRKPIPLKARLEACLLLLKIDPKDVQWDHDPPLGLRSINDAGTDYEPPQHDPQYIQPLSAAAHALKTDGDHVPLSGDKSRISKAKRIRGKAGPARSQGVQAACDGLPATANPYPDRSQERSLWAMGWHAERYPKLRNNWRKRVSVSDLSVGMMIAKPKRKIPSRPFPERWKPTGETK